MEKKMKYEIKNFQNQDNEKLVGFWVINDNNQRLAIDKTVPIVDGKTNEQYIQEALILCQNEIAKWQESLLIVGRTWNPDTGSFE
jgi:CHASE1-domain containing sensor protein